MPIETRLWKLGAIPKPIQFESMETESKLEKLLTADLGILSSDLFLLGSQIRNDFNKPLDLLALDREGSLVVIELKRDKTPRDAVAQLLDYGAWVKTLAYSELQQIYADGNPGKSLERELATWAGDDQITDVSGRMKLMLVAATLDPQSERILNFLSEDYGVPINAVFFRYFKEGDSEFLSRSWLIDPKSTEINVGRTRVSRSSVPWNGSDFYVAFGADESNHRNWDDAIKYGFVSAGGGRRYSSRLDELFTGSRIFVHIPKQGYVGVGVVSETTKAFNQFKVVLNGSLAQFSDLQVKGDYRRNEDDPEMCEYFVPVRWLKTVPIAQAFWEPGLYANQNVVTKMRSEFTVEEVSRRFGISE